MKKEDWKSTGTAVYNISYHFVWSTKYRRKVLFPPVDETLKGAITVLCKEHGYELWTFMESKLLRGYSGTGF